MLLLLSPDDVDEVAMQKESRNIGYFFDTCEGGNGAAEAIFSDFTKFTAASYGLAAECDCEAGCPRCLHSTAVMGGVLVGNLARGFCLGALC